MAYLASELAHRIALRLYLGKYNHTVRKYKLFYMCQMSTVSLYTVMIE